MTQEVTPDPGLADQYEKVCHDLRQNIAMGLLLSDPAAGGEHVVPGERVLLRRAVGNLLDDACRATPATGQVTVRMGSSGPEVWVEVADDGPGFGEGPRIATSIRMSFPVALRGLS